MGVFFTLSATHAQCRSFGARRRDLRRMLRRFFDHVAPIGPPTAQETFLCKNAVLVRI